MDGKAGKQNEENESADLIERLNAVSLARSDAGLKKKKQGSKRGSGSDKQ